MKMYKCCIFDLDGTLLDTLEGIAYTTNLTLEAFGFAPIETEHYKVLVGDGAGKLIERVLEESGDTEHKLYDEMLELYHKNFALHCMYKLRPYDGIPELLAFLKENGIKIAVFSNKPHPRTLDNIFGIFGEGYFDHVQGQKPDVERKPSPEGVYQVMEALGVEKADCLYVGDTNTDMMTGRNAGLDTAGVTWGFRCEEELRSYDPAYIVHHPSEIQDIIKKAK